jgi:CheY-like chemotaxis protein
MIPTILVVEDNTLNLELVRDVLTTAGMKVMEAHTAQEGLAAASQVNPTLILLDIRLPGMDGFAVLERLKASLGLSAGAAAWLVKPVQRHQFIEALDRVMPDGAVDRKQVALVVDDDAEAVELATEILRQRGFEVLQAFGGNEGLTLALERLPSLIILDLSMPGVSGFTVAQQLRANPRTRHTPILVSTALDLSPAEREQLLRHVQTIVPKSGAEGILEALQRLGLAPRRGLGPDSMSDPKVGSG